MTPPEDVRAKALQWFEVMPGDNGYSSGGQVCFGMSPFQNKGKVYMFAEIDLTDLLISAKAGGREEAIADIVSGKITENTLYKRTFEAGKAIGYQEGVKAMCKGTEEVCLYYMGEQEDKYTPAGMACLYVLENVKRVASQLLNPQGEEKV